MSARDDLRPATTSLPFEDLTCPGRSARSEHDRQADTARACELLGIPVTVSAPPQSPARDKEAGAQLFHAVEEYLREVFGMRIVLPAARHRRATAGSGSSLRDAA